MCNRHSPEEIEDSWLDMDDTAWRAPLFHLDVLVCAESRNLVGDLSGTTSTSDPLIPETRVAESGVQKRASVNRDKQ